MARARIRSSPRVSPNTQTRAERAASQTTTLRAMARDQAMEVETAAVAADLETRSSRVRMIKGEAKVVSRNTLTVIGKTDDHFTFHSTLLN